LVLNTFLPSGPAFKFYGTAKDTVLTWDWQFGDSAFSSEQNPSHTYDISYEHKNIQVCLTTSSPDNCTSTICKTIYWGGPVTDSCKANFDYSVSYPKCGDSLAMDSAKCLGASPVCSFYDYSSTNFASWYWNFGDGSYSTLRNPVHTYNTMGYATTYRVEFLGISASGCSDTIIKDVVIQGQTPPHTCAANFTYYLDSVSSKPFAYKFYDSSLGNIVTWNWNFGDGTFSNAKNPKHVFQVSLKDSIVVCLTVFSNDGCSDSRWIVLRDGTTQGYSLSGNVYTGHVPLTSGIVIAYLEQNNVYMPTGVAIVKTDGRYQINDQVSGNYIVYAIPNTTLPGKYFPTYYVDNLSWTKANVIDVNSNIFSLDIDLIKTYDSWSGVGIIKGHVNYYVNSADSGKLVLTSSMNLPVILSTGDGTDLTSTYADKQGNFEFDGLYFGSYLIRPELPNLKSTFSYQLNLSQESPLADNVQLTINSSEIVTGIPGTIIAKDAIEMNYLPHSQEIRIRTTQRAASILHIQVINSVGQIRQVNEIKMGASDEKTMSIQNLSRGFYIVRAVSENKTLSTYKLIK
jgi:PKD repeat protein